MFRNFTTTLLKGLFALLPLIISIYILVWLFEKAEKLAANTVLVFWPDALYVPGMGVLVVVAIIYGFGLLVENPRAIKVFRLLEEAFKILPVMRTLYTAIKDFTDYFSPGKDKKSGQVVLVRFPDTQLEMIGLLTRERLDDIPAPLTKDQHVAVYLPMSYQLGGYTIFIPRQWIQPTNLPVETALRSALTAWLPAGQAKKSKDADGA